MSKIFSDGPKQKNIIDNCSKEINALLKRLFKIRSQLKKQKEYISVVENNHINSENPVDTNDTFDNTILKYRHNNSDVSYNSGLFKK